MFISIFNIYISLLFFLYYQWEFGSHMYRNQNPISPSACVVLKMEDATRTAQCVHKHSGIVSTAGLSLQNTQHCLAVLLLCYDTFTVQHKGVKMKMSIEQHEYNNFLKQWKEPSWHRNLRFGQAFYNYFNLFKMKQLQIVLIIQHSKKKLKQMN